MIGSSKLNQTLTTHTTTSHHHHLHHAEKKMSRTLESNLGFKFGEWNYAGDVENTTICGLISWCVHGIRILSSHTTMVMITHLSPSPSHTILERDIRSSHDIPRQPYSSHRFSPLRILLSYYRHRHRIFVTCLSSSFVVVCHSLPLSCLLLPAWFYSPNLNPKFGGKTPWHVRCEGNAKRRKKLKNIFLATQLPQ